MLERLAALEDEFAAVEAELVDPAVLADPNRLRRAAKRHKDLGAIVSRYREYRGRQDHLEAAREMLGDATGDDRDSMRLEAAEAEADLERLGDELRELLLPRDPNDEKNVIVEIRGAEGGDEASLFARDLFGMYEGYAARMGWKLEVLGADASDMGGFNEVTFLLKGDNVWSRMKHEGGRTAWQRARH